MDKMEGGDINPLASIQTIIDPDRRRQKKEEHPEHHPEPEEEEREENVIVELHGDEDELSPHVYPKNNSSDSERPHENGKGDKIDYTI